MRVEFQTAKVGELSSTVRERTPTNVNIIGVYAELPRSSVRPVNWIYVDVIGRAGIAGQLLAIAIEDIMAPDCFVAASEHMWIIPLRIQFFRILGRYTTRQTFPRVAIAEVCTVRSDENQLNPLVNACRTWSRRRSNEGHCDNHILAIRCKIPSLELIRKLSCNATRQMWVKRRCTCTDVSACRYWR